MKRLLSLFAAGLFLVGCGTLTPKKVEFFQDKVQAFPEQSASLRELERQAIYRASEKASETVVAAVAECASTKVVAPATETKILTEAVAVALGPPKAPAVIPSAPLAVKLETAVAKYNVKVEDFKIENNKNEGKKIEGTGWFQVGYFYWIGGILAAVLILFFIGKLALTILSVANPGAAVGLGVVNVAQSVLTKGFSQLVKGGENFKEWVSKEIPDEGLQEKVLHAFQTAHMKAQDQEVQNTIRAVTS